MRRSTIAAVTAGIAVLTACSSEQQIATPTEERVAPLLAVGQQSAPDRYIVVFKPDVADIDGETERATRGTGSQVHFRYSRVLKGFAASIPAAALDGIRRNPSVEYVEADGVAHAIATQSNPPSWGLDRIDQGPLPLNQSYLYNNDGSGARVYILDTGIRYTHVQFGGRAVTGRDFVSNDDVSEDCQGHGTHVAGTVGGSTTGVAKQTTLVGVRVLGCNGSGSYAGIIAAVDWVTGQQASFPTRRFVGNMSLTGGLSSALNTAVNNSVNAGVVWAVAAGNDDGYNACELSPAGASGALTVGATSSNDARASFSNIGTCLDLFAPGVGIYSSTFGADNTYGSWNGTSMATPHVAGVAALYFTANPNATAAQVNAAIVSGATPNLVTNAGAGSPNRLLNSLVAGAAPSQPPGNTPPTASFTYSCTGLTCNFNGTGGDSDGNVVSYAWTFGDGSSSSAEDPSKTYASGGTRTVSLTVTDDDGAATTTSQQVTVTAPQGTVSITALVASSSWKNSSKRQWHGSVLITVRNGSGNLVSGATVTGNWSGGTTGSTSCTTNASGQCTALKQNLASSVGSVTWTVASISASGLTYSAGGNVVSTTVVDRPL